MRLLLVEDDATIGESIRKGLSREGYAVDWVRDCRGAELAIDSEPYAMVLLDIGPPRKDGLAVLEGLRRRGNRVPVLILSERDAVAERATGLDGATGTPLPKPLYLDELATRIRTAMRGKKGRAAPLLTWGTLTLDPATRRVALHGQDVPLSSREFALLRALLERPGAMLSRAQLEEELYGWGEEVASNSVEVHIHNLRKKLGEDTIRTVRGLGYSIAGGEGDSASQ